MGSNGNDHNCTHCGCHNPIWNTLKHTLETGNQPHAAHEPAKEPTGESIIFTEGTIYPLRDGNMDERVGALGIHAGDVVASGTLEAVEASMQAKGITNYQVRSLHGKTLLPGLIEPHAHIVQTCAMTGWLNLGAIEEETQRLRPTYDWNWLKEQIQSNLPKNDSDWILGHLVDPALMPPTKSNDLITFHCGSGGQVGNLDTIESQRPMLLISASLHTVYLNSAASKAVFDKTGMKADNGVLQEEPGVMAAVQSIPPKQQQEMLNMDKRLTAYLEEASKRGVTLLYDALMDDQSKQKLDDYFQHHPRNLRIGYALSCDGTLEGIGNLPPYSPPTREEAKTIYQGAVKLVSDGSNQGLTGYQSVPYCCETTPLLGSFNFCEDDNHPTPQRLPAKYKAVVRLAVDTGWPLMIHANGDRAIDFTLQAYKNALQDGSALERRHRIEHCSLLTDDNLNDMKKLGISPSFLIGHVGYWGYSFQNVIFKDKADHMLDRCQSALDHDLKISLHSDCSVTPLGPLRLMEQAVTRKMEGIRDAQNNFVQDPSHQPILNEAECLTRKQALKAVTYDAAWHCQAEGWTGSLQDGNFADFVILEQDPLDEKVPATSIRDIKVCETWIGGRKVYVNTDS